MTEYKLAPDQSSFLEATPAWSALKEFTRARIALGRTGVSLPTNELLEFRLAHARARDAVHEALDVEALTHGLVDMGINPIAVSSRAENREHYLLRPDLGRRLSDMGIRTLEESISQSRVSPCVIAFVVADGLSARAVQTHALPTLKALQALGLQLDTSTFIVATQARVALGDEIGEVLGAEITVVLIGERPGLSAPDSMGIYMTWHPRVGRNDSERNCISNIRPEGLSYAGAAQKLAWLIAQARVIGKTGVDLKEASEYETDTIKRAKIVAG
jgi:ethanolamine ammonia-lyase small subunit